MNNIVRYSVDELRNIDVSEELRRLAELPDDQINTADIPERSFDITRAVQRRDNALQPVVPRRRKAS